MRRAEWRRRVDDPKGLLGWWWRGFRHSGLGIPLAASTILAIAALFFPNVLVPVTLGIFCPALGLWISLGRSERSIGTYGDLRPRLLDPPPTGQFRTAVEYRREGMTTGRDDMALTVVDGWLVAEGVRSDFALRWSDVKSPSSWTRRQKRIVLTDGSEIVLHRMDDDFEARATMRQWLRARAPVPGEPMFPPARVHPQQEARWFAWMVSGEALVVAALALRIANGVIDELTAFICLGGGGLSLWVGQMRLLDLRKCTADGLNTPTQGNEKSPIGAILDPSERTIEGDRAGGPVTLAE